MTSEDDGISPSAPKPPLRSNRDDANAWAAQHARAVHQRRNHAFLAARRISLGSERALARAKCLRNDWASSDHLPPVSHPSTTSRARPCSPVNSGYVRSFVASLILHVDWRQKRYPEHILLEVFSNVPMIVPHETSEVVHKCVHCAAWNVADRSLIPRSKERAATFSCAREHKWGIHFVSQARATPIQTAPGWHMKEKQTRTWNSRFLFVNTILSNRWVVIQAVGHSLVRSATSPPAT